jgi:NADPH2:quinone reductase
MKAAIIRQTGSPDVIEIADLPSPQPRDGEVLIDVRAVSVNPIDTYVRSGAVASDLPNPFIIGCDAAGVVAALGEGVSNASVGDRVWCTNQGLLRRQGTFAEQIAVGADWCYQIPDGISFDDAAACGLVAVTAHFGLFRNTMLQAGETILVIGGTGGVGSMVVQMAKAIGAAVIATGGSDEKCQLARTLGADVTINYRTESISDAVHREAPKGVNVFWETRREPDFDMAVDLLAERGRMVVMAGRDARPSFPVGPFYVKECSLHGLAMFKATAVEMRTAADEVNHWLANGKIRANIAATMQLDQAAEAHHRQEAATLAGSGDLTGKIVLTVGSPA